MQITLTLARAEISLQASIESMQATASEGFDLLSDENVWSNYD
jgi:hypothetical protein